MILHLAKHELKPGITAIEMKGSIHGKRIAGGWNWRSDRGEMTLVIFDFTHISHRQFGHRFALREPHATGNPAACCDLPE